MARRKQGEDSELIVKKFEVFEASSYSYPETPFHPLNRGSDRRLLFRRLLFQNSTGCDGHVRDGSVRSPIEFDTEFLPNRLLDLGVSIGILLQVGLHRFAALADALTIEGEPRARL